MLTLKANLERKPTDFSNHFCQIEKIIELPKNEFDALVSHPYHDRAFIAENRDLMGQWNGAHHCLLALDEAGNDGILIEAEGAGYIRYGAYVSHARDFVERELERTAAFFLKDISPDLETGEITIYLDDIAEHTGTKVRDDSEIARMFYRILKEYPAVDGVEAVDDCLVVTPATAQTQGATGGLKLRDVLLLGGMENVYVVHEASDECCASAEYFAMLTSKGREDHAELLNSAVVKIRPGNQGVEVVLSGIDLQMLMDFAQAADNHIQAESMMGPTM